MALDTGLTVGLALGAAVVLRFLLAPNTRASVPLVESDFFLGYKTAIKTMGDYKQMMIKGHAKFKGKPFQLPSLRGWVVHVSRALFEDMRKMKDADGLSLVEEIKEGLAVQYTIGKPVGDDPWHVGVVRKQMTQNLGAKLAEIHEEIAETFAEEIVLKDNEWKPIPAYDLVLHVVCRASNRLFIGLPLCRDKEFNKLSEEFTLTVSKAGFLISLFPEFLKPLAAKYISGAPKATAGFEKYVGPVIDDRLRGEREFGEEGWKKQKPFDFLQWMIDAAAGPEQLDRHELCQRMMSMNFTALHTSSLSFTHALYWLASHPQYIPELREEAERVVKEQGWTKDALNNMVKADSFLKESMRLTGLNASNMERKCIKPYTFSDGTHIPKGAHVSLNLWAIHHDPELYPEPMTFDPWRYSRRVEAGESAVKNAFTTAASDYVFWGAGAHVCAGRYFASQEMKTMLALIVMQYDVKMEQEGVRPPDVWFGTTCIPNPKAMVLFRKRNA